MMTRVKKWMDSAKWAASGGNAQPWSVLAKETDTECVIEIAIDENYRKHPSPMDVDGLASALALGCLAKNLEFVAANDGYEIDDVVVTPAGLVWDGKVQLRFRKSSRASSPYSNDVIQERRTDRNRYQSTPISSELIAGFQEIAARPSQIHFYQLKENRAAMAPPLAKIEQVRLRSATFLGGLLNELSFGEPEAEPTKIPVGQLGLAMSDRVMLRALKKMPSLRSVLKTGADALPIRRAVYDFCEYADRVCFLEAALDQTGGDFGSAFEFGRVYQELWLYAAKNGISFQPMGLPLIALAHWRNVPDLELSASQKTTLEDVTESVRVHFGIDFRKLVLGFRLGYPTVAARKAPRRDVMVREL